jgi:hypothetical protein
MLDFDLSNRFNRGTKLSHRNTLRQFCPTRDRFVPRRLASYTDPVHSTKLSQLGQNCPNKSAWDNFVHSEVY